MQGGDVVSDFVEISAAGVCSKCRGKVSNITGRRLSRSQLAEIHARSCPGLRSRRSTS